MTIIARHKEMIHMAIVIAAVALLMIASQFIDPIKADAATNYPVLSGESGIMGYTMAELSDKYSFQYIGETYPGSYDVEPYAVIKYRNKDGSDTITARISIKGEMLCVGKYKGKFYFNVVEGSSICKYVYTYKLGDSKFRKLPNSKGINLHLFRKRDVEKRFAKFNGIIQGRYIVARHEWPTEGAEGLGIVSIYDLKKNTRQKLGRVQDLVIKGKKRKQIFWVTTNNRFYNKNTKILVKSSSISGKNIKVRKSYKAAFLEDTYGRGEITAKYVKWGWVIHNGKKYISKDWKRKY